MKTEEDAFIRALRERPDDETTRLVYADWLDDRSDPRAEYLRAEAAWVALQPSDEQYRPLYRRVSQLAVALEPEWFATVSRMGHLVRREWKKVSRRWELHPAPDPSDPLHEWLTAEGHFERTFARFVGPEATVRRFCAPVDYLAFGRGIGGEWRRQDEWDLLYSAPRAAEMTLGGGLLSAKEIDERREIWVLIATSGGAHDVFLCCDLDCPRFGEVAEIEALHPWIVGSAPMRGRGGNFLHFLACWGAID